MDDRSKLLYNLSTYFLKELVDNYPNDNMSRLTEIYKPKEIDDKQISLIHLINILFTNYPFFNDHLSSLDWSFDNFINSFCDENRDINVIKSGDVEYSIADLVFFNKVDFKGTDLDIIGFDDYFYRSDFKPHSYYSNGHYYIEDDLNVINYENDLYLKNKKNISDNNDDLDDWDDYKEYNTDNELDIDYLVNSLNDQLKRDGKISIDMFYQFIRNGFAHFEWKYEDGVIEIYHTDEVTGNIDFDVRIGLESLYLLIFDYTNILLNHKYHYKENTIFDDLNNYDCNEYFIEYDSYDILPEFLNQINKTKYRDDFNYELKWFDNKYQDYDYYEYKNKTMLDYILKYGDLSLKDKDIIINNQSDIKKCLSLNEISEYININNLTEVKQKLDKEKPNIDYDKDESDYLRDLYIFLKKYISDKPDLLNLSKKKLMLILNELTKVNIKSGDVEKDSIKDKYKVYVSQANLDNDYTSLIINLLNVLYVQNDYYDVNIDTINFKTFKINEEFINTSFENNIINKNNEDSIQLNNTLLNYYENYYNAQVNELNNKACDNLLAKANNYLEKYDNALESSNNNNKRRYERFTNTVRNINNYTIITHLRNSIAHGYVDISVYDEFNIWNSDIIIRDYDKRGKLSFSATVKLTDLIENAFNPYIMEQLYSNCKRDNNKLMIKKQMEDI